jgi:hypothetical protein
MPAPKAAVRNKLRKLADTIEELREAKNLYWGLNITRLTSIKSLCDNHDIAKQFVLFLARRTIEKMEEKACSPYKEPEEWDKIKAFAFSAFQCLQECFELPEQEQVASFHELFLEIRNFQNTHQPGKYGSVRIIQSQDILLLEYMLECIMSSQQYGKWAYQVARQYVEGSSYENGLLPESIPMLEEILDFWHRYYYHITKVA